MRVGTFCLKSICWHGSGNLDLRQKVPTLIIILLVSQILCAQGIFEFPAHSLEFAHLIPADKVDEVLAWEEGLDTKFAVLTHLTRFIGIWWKHASKKLIDELAPKCMGRHSCEKLCAFIMPAGHAAYRAVLPARTSDHYFCSQIILPTTGMKVVQVNWHHSVQLHSIQ